MPQREEDKGFDDLMHDLEDNIFGVTTPPKRPTSAEEPETPTDKLNEAARPGGRRATLPTLVDKATADKILKDFMKEKNQRKYDLMGFELLFKPYWFFTYSAELAMRDSNKNITDAEELSGRIAIDAVNASLADYLQDLLDHEPIETTDLTDEIAQVGGDVKLIEPKISEDRVEKMVQQKIAGVLKTENENVAVAGFELMWSPVYRYWMTIKKKTHNVQIDGCGGYPVNYDDVPLKAKTWVDVILDDVGLLKDPKKWREFLTKKGKAVRGMASGGGADKKSSKWGVVEAILALGIGVVFLKGLSDRDALMMLVGAVLAGLLFWYMNHKRPKPLLPLPPPPFMGPEAPPQ